MEDIIAKYQENETKYLLPIIKKKGNERRQYDNALHLVNSRLKDLSAVLGLRQPLTMYVARHSWASAAKASNVPLAVVSEAWDMTLRLLRNIPRHIGNIGGCQGE